MTAKLIHITTKVVVGLLLAVIVGALAVVTVIPRAVHGVALTVLTGSMTPTIPVGSVVVVRPVDPGTLHVGDIITFQKKAAKAEFITHRIVSIHTNTAPVTLTTKGDANRGADVAPVPVTAVRGRVLFHVPYLGTIRSAIGTSGGGLLLLLLGLVAYAIQQLASGLRDRRAPANPALPQLVATLPVAELDALLPRQFAQLLQMDLLDENSDEFTVAVTREPDELTHLTQLLMIFRPLSLRRSDDDAFLLELVGGAHVAS
jgi:signal peptidase